MNELLTILLDQQTGQEGGSAWSGMIMILAMIVIFYFFMIRPQSKKQKELKKAREAMKKGDKVVTAGGIHGVLRDVREDVVKLEVDKNIVLVVDKASVFAVPANSNSSVPEKKPKAEKESLKEEKSDAGDDLDAAAGKVVK